MGYFFGAYEKAKNLYHLEGLRVCFSKSDSKMRQKRFLHEKMSHGPIGRYDPRALFHKNHFYV